MDRGILLLPHESSINVNHALLYWDKLEIPKIILVDAPMKYLGAYTKVYSQQAQLDREQDTDYQFLITEGILSRPEIVVNSGLHMSAIKHVIDKESRWAFASSDSDDELNIMCDGQGSHSIVEIELYSVLPSPGDVPYEEIFQFKDKRKEELQLLRSAMDELYLEIINSNDIPRSKTVALQKLDRALSALNKVAMEKWPARLLSSMKIELNVPNLAVNALAGATVAAAMGLSYGLGAAIGCSSAAVKFEFKKERRFNSLPSWVRDFEYIFHVKNEL